MKGAVRHPETRKAVPATGQSCMPSGTIPSVTRFFTSRQAKNTGENDRRTLKKTVNSSHEWVFHLTPGYKVKCAMQRV